MQIGDTPENLRERVRPVLAAGKEVGLRMAIIARHTRKEAIRSALPLNPSGPSLTYWLGAVNAYGPATVYLVGSPQDLADVFMEYKKLE
jgi:alkanesulfonate monooxygenase SsuD/methylene tetrahydromethanopterin reductase-like flavin-dependent oxidoreductase (luciferase family)